MLPDVKTGVEEEMLLVVKTGVEEEMLPVVKTGVEEEMLPVVKTGVAEDETFPRISCLAAKTAETQVSATAGKLKSHTASSAEPVSKTVLTGLRER